MALSASSRFPRDVGALPNITGSIEEDAETGKKPTGSFYLSSESPTAGAMNDRVGVVIGFDASRSHPVYGLSNTIQPSSMMALPCIKI